MYGVFCYVIARNPTWGDEAIPQQIIFLRLLHPAQSVSICNDAIVIFS